MPIMAISESAPSVPLSAAPWLRFAVTVPPSSAPEQLLQSQTPPLWPNDGDHSLTRYYRSPQRWPEHEEFHRARNHHRRVLGRRDGGSLEGRSQIDTEETKPEVCGVDFELAIHGRAGNCDAT